MAAIMWLSLGGRIKRRTPSVCLSDCSVPPTYSKWESVDRKLKFGVMIILITRK